MQRVDREQVKELVQSDEDVALVDVLPTEMFEDYHLPGAMNVPLNEENFESRIQNAAPDKQKPVIVYCRDEDCEASGNAATILDRLEYSNVYHYKAGKVDWKNAGLPIEGKRAA